MINFMILAEAQVSSELDAARNGTTGGRERRTTSLRLPLELREELKRASSVLKGVFPEKYVTVNSTIEFLLRRSLDSFWSKEVAEEE